MSLFLITGTAGVGKSAVCEQLKTNGYQAFDTDTDGLAKWQNIETSVIHPKSSVKEADRTPEFLNIHRWNVPRAEVEELRNNAVGNVIYLCGNMSNESELYDLFDDVVALYVDDETLKHRLATRTTGGWGKRPHELEHTLARHRTHYDAYRASGTTIIDATQPL